MKWYNSIITKISLIFLLAIIGIGTVLILFLNHEMRKEIENVQDFARYALHSSFDMRTRKMDFQNLENLGLKELGNTKLINEILRKKEDFDKHHKDPNMMHRMMGANIVAVPLKDKIYIVLKRGQRNARVFETPFKKEIFSSIIYPAIFLMLVVLLYIAIIRSIMPLYDLRKKIQRFADGDYEIECRSRNKDEIGILSNDFDNAVKKIKKLRDSRQLFLRNIMHELKTPIAKGKFATELAEDKNLKKTLENIFVRQETLLEEFSRIEKLNANELKINKQPYLFEDVLDFAADILAHDIDKVEKNLMPIKINVDFELFGTAIKNLLDNGINYSVDSKVHIMNDEKKIVISNTGPELEFPLQSYKEPFRLDGKKQKSSRGLGFGLYITLHIIELHNMRIIYKREEGENIFTLLL